MSLAIQLAQRFREVMLDGTWVTGTNYKTELSNLNWKKANAKVESLNTLAAIAFHVHYYIAGVLQVFEGGTLDIRDKYSFDMQAIESQADWETLLKQIWTDSEKFASSIEQMSDKELYADFVDGKYGNILRNINVLIEHSYYHLGQVILIKKMLAEKDKNLSDGLEIN